MFFLAQPGTRIPSAVASAPPGWRGPVAQDWRDRVSEQPAPRGGTGQIPRRRLAAAPNRRWCPAPSAFGDQGAGRTILNPFSSGDSRESFRKSLGLMASELDAAEADFLCQPGAPTGRAVGTLPLPSAPSASDASASPKRQSSGWPAPGCWLSPPLGLTLRPQGNG